MSFQHIPMQRLHPVDLYHMIDWIKEGWQDHEYEQMPRLARLKWHLLELPERFHGRAIAQYEILLRARMVQGVDHEPALAALRRLVSEWGRTRRRAA